ncbi:MAG: hypothetical protein K6F49_13390 [Saccharofermentans sp.]|nr:hypothetical protein [Saccharofermentans sp.]
MIKKVLTAVLSALCVVFIVLGILHLRHAARYVTVPKVDSRVEIVSVSKDSYEIQDDGTVLIYCTYILRNNYVSPLDVNVFGIFFHEKSASFLQENVLYSGTTYTIEPGIDTIINVVYEGHLGVNDTMPDRLPPDSYVVVREQPYVEE